MTGHIPHIPAGASNHTHPEPGAEAPASSECSCFIVKHWITVQRLDEQVPVYEKCPLHPDRFDTEGFGEDRELVTRLRGPLKKPGKKEKRKLSK